MIKKIYNNYTILIMYFVFLLPFLDIYRALVGNKIQLFGISLVEIFNILLTTMLFILLGIKFKNEKKKILSYKNIIYVVTVIVYILLHCIYILSLTNLQYLHTNISFLVECYYIFRTCILPLIVLFAFLKSELKPSKIVNTLSKLCFIYCIIIVITNILGIALVAYSSSYDGIVQIKGNIFSWFTSMDKSSIDLYTSRGLFYSTNQISAIVGALLFVSAFYTMKQDKIKYYLSFFIKVIAAIMLSTKTAFFAIFLSIASVYIYNLIFYIIHKKSELTKKCWMFLIFVLIVGGIYRYSPIRYKLEGYIQNINNNNIVELEEDPEMASECKIYDQKGITEKISLNDLIMKSNLTFDEKEYFINYLKKCPAVFNVHKEFVELYPVNENYNYWKHMLKQPISTLTNYREFKYSIYNDFIKRHDNKLDILFGIGYSSDFPYLEKDFVGQYVWLGLIGVILLLGPFIFILLKSIFKFILSFRSNFNSINVSLTLSAGFMIFASFFAGHVFGIFMPSTILAFIISGLYTGTNKKNEIKDNKITFLLLHLGYGGIETSTINTANALCDKYDVELISFYNLPENQDNKIDKRITVKHLYNGEPNKNEFMKALKEHNYFKVLKEGIKSIDILIKKKIYIIKSIIDCDSKYIVSTRWDFSLLLSKFGSKDNIKIAQEHHYHNNDKKYIHKLKKYYNIDYLFALTKKLENDYKKILKKNKHTKVVLVPNMLNEIPNKKSDLDEKNIVTVSRLDPGKKNDEIIKAFSKIKEKDWNLYIIGDGKEYNNLINLVKELNIEDRVILTGYKNKKEIEDYLLKSSIFLMASITEGLPMVLLEAMSYGIPCIAYETPSGTSDIIKDNINGYIIKDRNEMAYIEKIEEVISNDKLRKTLGNNAKKTVNAFSKEQILKIWFRILR